MKLSVGCGNVEREEGTTYLDRVAFPCVDVVHDLNVTPWPFADSGFVHVSALHVVEHLDSLVEFMDEAWRVLAPGGSLYLKTPLAGGDADLEWADPTHKRCYRPHTFINYFTPEGVERWGYTQRAWCLAHLEAVESEITVHAFPIKP